MDRILEYCAGFDVHKKLIWVCALRVLAGGEVQQVLRSFGTMTRDLLALSDWLAELGVTHVAMESTGVFWKPIYNVLEGRFEILLVNAQHIKQVPGRKTDVKDCQWIAQLLMHGLLKASFVPERGLRDLRDLTRHRAQLVSEKTREANRIHKVLEDANIKLGSVASDILGVSGRDMIRAIISGKEDPEELAELARRKLRNKMAELHLALQGHATEHHRFLLRMHLDHVEYMEKQIEQLTQRIEQLMQEDRLSRGADHQGTPGTRQGPINDPLPPMNLNEAISFLKEVCGTDVVAAQALLSEIGTDMSRFPSAEHLSSWAGMCPGNHESAGKRKSGKTTKGNRWIRSVLCQMAWAASHAKDSYFNSLYHRLAPRRGKKRALVAVGHALLVTIYHMLKNHTHYKDLGSQWFARLHPERLTRYLVKRLEALGLTVTLEELNTTQPVHP